MPDTTFEEAKRCPQCEQPGKPHGTKSAGSRRAGTLHIFMCKNENCKWFDTTWSVQVRPDGTIPEPTLDREKSYPMMDGMSTRARIQKARAAVDASLNQSLGR